MVIHSTSHISAGSAAVSSMLCDDSLPAARYLTGHGAFDVLRAPIEAAGGQLVSVTPRNVQYRPGADLVIKYSAEVAWQSEPVKRETIMAKTTVHGSLDATLRVTAVIDGRRVDVGVWRWPFDPVLVGLTEAVTTRSAARLCGFEDAAAVSVKVLAFRPTERAVVRVSGPSKTFYLKVVAPSSVARLVNAHSVAADAGVPVPRVRASFDDLGIVVLDELPGPLLKDQIKAGTGIWPRHRDFDDLADRLASIRSSLPTAPERIRHAVSHATMLRTLDDAPNDRLDRLGDAFSSFAPEQAQQPVHGDLHEGQIVVRDGRISGVLDLDDLGLGSPQEERANLIGFLRYRAITLPAQRQQIDVYADQLRIASGRRHDLAGLDVSTAAVLVGLATGPFRIQQPGWRDTVNAVIESAVSHIATASVA